MIYVENDFYSNFNNAVKSNDEPSIENMLVDQFSNLIAKKRTDVISMLKKVDITLSANPTNEEISTSIATNLRSNKKLQAGLAFLIAKENGILASAEKKSRTEGGKGQGESGGSEAKKSKKDIDWDKTANTVTSLANTIGVFAEALKGGRDSKFEQDLANQSNVKAPNYSASAYGQNTPAVKAKKKKTWIWVLAGVAVVGIGIYGYKQGWFKGGGEVPAPPLT